jgi:hypothetical protein
MNPKVDELHINKGVELLLRRKTKSKKPKTFHLKFSKMISFFKREIHIYFEFFTDIKKRG